MPSARPGPTFELAAATPGFAGDREAEGAEAGEQEGGGLGVDGGSGTGSSLSGGNGENAGEKHELNQAGHLLLSTPTGPEAKPLNPSVVAL